MDYRRGEGRLFVRTGIVPVLTLGILIHFLTAGLLFGMSEEGTIDSRNAVKQIMLVSRFGDRTTLTVVSEYNGSPEAIPWFIPLPNEARDVRISSGDRRTFGFIEFLEILTDPGDSSTPTVGRIFTESVADERQFQKDILETTDGSELVEWYQDRGLRLSPGMSEKIFAALDSCEKCVTALCFPGNQIGESRMYLPTLTVSYESPGFAVHPPFRDLGSATPTILTIYVIGEEPFWPSDIPAKALSGDTSVSGYRTVEGHFNNAVYDFTGGNGGRLVLSWAGLFDRYTYHDEMPETFDDRAFRNLTQSRTSGEADVFLSRWETRSWTGFHWTSLYFDPWEDFENHRYSVYPPVPASIQLCLRIEPVAYFRHSGTGWSFAAETALEMWGRQARTRKTISVNTLFSVNFTNVSRRSMIGFEFARHLKFLSVGLGYLLELHQDTGGSGLDDYIGLKIRIRPFDDLVRRSFCLGIDLLSCGAYVHLYSGEVMWSLGLISCRLGWSSS